MKSRGIIFSAQMVRADLEGRKFCTRRIDKSWLKYKKGDEIWVKEVWADLTWVGVDGIEPNIIYRADGFVYNKKIKWKSPIFMPRYASRITRTLTEDARLERLQDITLGEIRAEGISEQDILNSLPMFPPPKYKLDSIIEFMAEDIFEQLWDSLHPKKDRWADNPEVVRLCWLPEEES